MVPLAYLSNLSINEGIFPNELKIAKVIPIYKVDNDQSINNYRPTLFNRIFRKYLRGYIYLSDYFFLRESNILNENQIWFSEKS